MPSKIIPQDHKDAMVAAYLSGKTAKEAAEPFGYSWMACIGELRRRDIQPRGRSEAHRKYAVNESYFDRIDTEEKAYWLGFLTADGDIGDNHIQLRLSAKDKTHLSKFTTSIQSEHPITDSVVTIKDKKYKVAGLHIGSQRLASVLAKHGVTPRKSMTVEPCPNIPAHLIHHYWRGILDGDGCISGSRNRGDGSLKWSVAVVGSRWITAGFGAWVRTFIDSEAEEKPHAQVYQIRFNGTRMAKAILERLYDGATIWLDRKQELALKVMSSPIQRQDRSTLTQNELKSLYNECGSWNAVAEKLGTSRGRLHHIRKRLAA